MLFRQWEIFEAKTFLSVHHPSFTSHKEYWERLSNGASEKELGFDWKKIKEVEDFTLL